MSGAFEKRVKRNITARKHDFFIVVSPGLEKSCLRECRDLYPEIPEFKMLNGGIEFTSRVLDVFHANLNLRCASRILMRIDTFKATTFSQLEKKITSIPWELYLKKKCRLAVSVSTTHSRLYHQEAIRERAEAWIQNQLNASGGTVSESKTEQLIHIRAVDDRFVVSIDSSGDLLFKRGIKTHGGTAPVRESIASGLLFMSGFKRDRPLFDPMCGSGTFGLEAAMIKSRIPAGWYRKFAFMDWPCFRKQQWDYLKKQLGKAICIPEAHSVFSSDSDQDGCEKLKKTVLKTGFGQIVSIETRDLFDIPISAIPERAGLFMINPPYGKRISSMDEDHFYKKLFQKLITDFPGWKFGIFTSSGRVQKHSPVKLKTRTFFHGGLHITLYTGTINV